MRRFPHRRPTSIEAGDHRRYRSRPCVPSKDRWGRAVHLSLFTQAPGASDGAPECVLAAVPATEEIRWAVIGSLQSGAELGDDQDFLRTLHHRRSNQMALAEAERRLDDLIAQPDAAP